MCKPTCCSNDNGSGLGIVIAVFIGLAVIVAAARPVIHAAEDLLKIVLVTVSALTALAILATVIIAVIRLRRTRHTTALSLTHMHSRQTAESPALAWQARQVKPGTWSYRDPRFIYRKFELTQPSTGCEFCDGKIAEWLDAPDSLDLDATDRLEIERRWS